MLVWILISFGRRGQMTAVRRQMTEGRGQKAETSVICYLSSVFWNTLMGRNDFHQHSIFIIIFLRNYHVFIYSHR